MQAAARPGPPPGIVHQRPRHPRPSPPPQHPQHTPLPPPALPRQALGLAHDIRLPTEQQKQRMAAGTAPTPCNGGAAGSTSGAAKRDVGAAAEGADGTAVTSAAAAAAAAKTD